MQHQSGAAQAPDSALDDNSPALWCTNAESTSTADLACRAAIACRISVDVPTSLLPYLIFTLTMPDPTPKTIHLKDYSPSAFLIPTVELDVAIFEDYTRVTSRLAIRRNPAAADRRAPLVLDGEELALDRWPWTAIYCVKGNTRSLPST